MSLKDCRVGTAVPVPDMSRARKFYEGTLGLEADEQGDAGVAYPCGGGTGLFVYVTEHAGTNKATLAGFEVSDFDAEHTELKDNGVQFETYDQEGLETNDEGIIEGGPYRVAFFKDPDGNIFSING